MPPPPLAIAALATATAAAAGKLQATVGRGRAAPNGQTTGAATANADNADGEAGGAFACERVCASPKLISKMGWSSKDPTPGACLTVCGPSEQEACTEACVAVMCSAQHDVPAWNDACVKRCTTECARVTRRR